MPKRQQRYQEKPWKPDPDRWRKLLEPAKGDPAMAAPPTRPDKGWQLWDWKTLEDKPQE